MTQSRRTSRRPWWLVALVAVAALATAGSFATGSGPFAPTRGRADASPTVPPTTSSTTTTSTSATTSTTTTTAVAPPDTQPPAPPAPAAPPVTAAAAAPVPDPPAPAGGFDDDAARQIISFMNAQRAANGIGPLAVDGCLTSLARGWSQSMGERQKLSHDSAFASCNSTAGENVGMWSPCSTSSIANWWMSSATHRDNILNPAYGSTGVGVWTDSNGACWYTADFGP